MTPTVGRIVHTRLARGDDPVPAIICRVYSDGSNRIDICAFTPYPMPFYGVTMCATEEEADEPQFIGQYRAWWPPREPAPDTVPLPNVPLADLADHRVVREVSRVHTGEPTMVRPQGHPTIELRFTDDATPEERGQVIKAAYDLYPDHRVVVVGGMREVTR